MKKLLLPFLMTFLSLTVFGQMVKLTPPANAMGDRIKFGSAIGLSGDVLAVGTPDEDINGNDNIGTVYVYTRTNGTWGQSAKLTSPSNDVFKQFGAGVATDGDFIAVGSFDGLTGGQVYMFAKNGNNWTQTTKLVPSPASPAFGSAIAFLGDMVLVGARGDRSGEGSIFVYRRNGTDWTFVKRIANPSPIASGFFGGVISVYQNKFITSGTGNANQGRAYIYNWNGSDFDLEATLVSSDIAATDQFGSGVSLNANEAAVGAYWDDDLGNESGSVYMFKRNGSNWVQTQKIVASNGNAGDNFGGAVALVNDKLIITSSTDSEFASFGGSAYEFTYSNGSWKEDSNFGSIDANQNEGFGRVVASSGKTVAFAASGDDQRGTFAGAVFLLDLDAASTSEKIALANSVEVFPNPVFDILNVNLNSLENFNSNNELNYRVVDTTGKIVLKGRMNSNFNQVNVSTLPGGNYVLEMDWNGLTFGKQFLK
jgi:hypothetical protein